MSLHNNLCTYTPVCCFCANLDTFVPLSICALLHQIVHLCNRLRVSAQIGTLLHLFVYFCFNLWTIIPDLYSNATICARFYSSVLFCTNLRICTLMCTLAHFRTDAPSYTYFCFPAPICALLQLSVLFGSLFLYTDAISQLCFINLCT